MAIRSQIVFGAALLIALSSIGGAIQAQSMKPATFSKEQAARGKKTFVAECVDCHGDDLRGGVNGGPPLRGRAFEQKFAGGAPASAMFAFMTATMPPNDPGRYSPADYAELMAYVLEQNGFEAGAPLPSRVEALDDLAVDK